MKRKINVYIKELDIKSISKGFCLPVEKIREVYRDARMLTLFTEEWAAEIYKYRKVGRDCKGYDLLSVGGKKISVKQLTVRGANISDSVYQGAGRSGTFEEISKSFLSADELVIVDITNFPTIRFYKFETELVYSWVESLEWTDKKINPKRNSGRSKNQPGWKISTERFQQLILNKFNTTEILTK